MDNVDKSVYEAAKKILAECDNLSDDARRDLNNLATAIDQSIGGLAVKEDVALEKIIREASWYEWRFGTNVPQNKAIKIAIDYARKQTELINNRLSDAEKKNKEMEKLLERASGLVGNPCTNISGSTDSACDEWQKDYKAMFPEDARS